MTKLHLEETETKDKKPAADDAPIGRRQLLVIAGTATCAGMLAACGDDGGPGGNIPRTDMRGAPVDMGGPRDLAPGPCMPKIATGAETLGVNQVMHFHDSGVREQSFYVVRDSRGFYALNDDCSHLHCRAFFNAAARTFDCGCHGSRFNFDGTVLNGPAPLPLNVFPMRRLGNGQLEVDICRFTTDRNARVT